MSSSPCPPPALTSRFPSLPHYLAPLLPLPLSQVPNMAANPLNPKKKMISKSFHRVLDTYNRQMFTGPPENVRDHVMVATKGLMRGDWAKSYQCLTSLSVWNLMPQKAKVLSMLKTKLQVREHGGLNN